MYNIRARLHNVGLLTTIFKPKFTLAILRRPLWKKLRMDKRYDSSLWDDDALSKSVDLLITQNGQLDVSWSDAMFSLVSAKNCIIAVSLIIENLHSNPPGQLSQLRYKVLEHSSHVDARRDP